MNNIILCLILLFFAPLPRKKDIGPGEWHMYYNNEKHFVTMTKSGEWFSYEIDDESPWMQSRQWKGIWSWDCKKRILKVTQWVFLGDYIHVWSWESEIDENNLSGVAHQKSVNADINFINCTKNTERNKK